MNIASLILEFLKVLLSGPVVAGAVAFSFIVLFRHQIRGVLSRTASIKFPGGGEFIAQQLPPKDDDPPSELPAPSEEQQPLLPATLTDQQFSAIRAILDSERARAYLWEYRFLNLFLVPTTQQVLEWFGSLESPITYAMYDSLWASNVSDVDQRRTIHSVLASHHLIQATGDLVQITPKGREYLEWRTKV